MSAIRRLLEAKYGSSPEDIKTAAKKAADEAMSSLIQNMSLPTLKVDEIGKEIETYLLQMIQKKLAKA